MVAHEAISICDMGAYLGDGVQSGVRHTLGPYNIPNYRVRSSDRLRRYELAALSQASGRASRC